MEDLLYVSEDNCSDNNNNNNNNNKKRSSRSRVGEVEIAASMELNHLDLPLLSATTASPAHSIRLLPHRSYFIGRSPRYSQFLFHDPRVSRRHCLIRFDPLLRKIYLLHGQGGSLSFLNGVRINRGIAMELSAGDEVSLVCCANSLSCSVRIGFVIQRIVFEEKLLAVAEVDAQKGLPQSQSLGPLSSRKGCKRVFASKADPIARANCLLSHCKRILLSDDPISYIRSIACQLQSQGSHSHSWSTFPVSIPDGIKPSHKELPSEPSNKLLKVCGNGADSLSRQNSGGVLSYTPTGGNSPKNWPFDNVRKDCSPFSDGVVREKIRIGVGDPPGKSFYLNRLGFMDNDTSSSQSQRTDISLQELLHPVETISQLFIATFTSDILWFLSSCEIPKHLPVTLACHNTERCWNSSPDSRTSVPYPDFPNLVVVYPPFPEDIAFGKDLKRQGIGCHHPKLFVIQRDDFLRVIITSANLVPTQWKAVTNTIWWQDFPRRSTPDYMSLFTEIQGRETNQESKSDFCSQLAGFMASLLIDVPRLAHWIDELTKYDFGEAMGDLVASVPGIHSYRAPYIFPSMHFLQGVSASSDLKFLGSVEASVVGLSYLFQNAADSNGAQIKKLASFLRNSGGKTNGFSKVVLRRNKNVPADENAVSILVPSPNEFPSEDQVQLGFLSRKVARWVSPLWDIGFFRFSAHVSQKQVLTAALGGSNKKVPLFIQVSQGPNFRDIPKMMQPEHIFALCSMIAAIQRCTGLWRLQEVLAQYKWPQQYESDFTYSASSIGSIDARFLSAFAAAAGKNSVQFDSEESDPEWGCWSASQERKTPSIKIIFPTINRVQNACNGVLPSRRILCLSEGTWERLRTINILHDAIPHPHKRVGHPMHIKVAQRRFKPQTNASSFGWVYCGSHNFSAAAWGRAISISDSIKGDEEGKAKSSLDLRLHVCNYELGIIFIFPPTEKNGSASKSNRNLDDIVLPFVVPAPKYGPRDRPATAKAMREAIAAVTEQERVNLDEAEEVPNEDESTEETDIFAEEKEEENAYAQILWNQIDSS